MNQALIASRAVEANDHRILNLCAIAKRLHALGEKDRASKLLREGQGIARELPTAAWAGYARGAFAEDLALIDLAGALELMKDLKDPFEYVRHHGNLARKLAGTNPAEAERIFRMMSKPGETQGSHQRDRFAVGLCYHMANADLPRARKIAREISDDLFKGRAHAVMARALAKSKPKEALAFLDEAFAIFAKRVASKADHFNNYYHAASLAGLSVPVAEAIDPTLVPEFFWRALSFSSKTSTAAPEDQWGMQSGAIGSVALTLGRYDSELALSLLTRVKMPQAYYSTSSVVLRANALADPHRAISILSSLKQDAHTDYLREVVVVTLLTRDEGLDKLIHGALVQWHIDNEDL